MKFNDLNISKYNVMKVRETVKCSVCNSDTNYVDYWNGNNFCSAGCQEKYYKWIRKNKESIA